MNKCIYCGKDTAEPHFESACCGRGMCDNCFNGLQGTEEQIQVDYTDDELWETIKPEYQNADYLCFECQEIWKKAN